jgi:hypothetical protein
LENFKGKDHLRDLGVLMKTIDLPGIIQLAKDRVKWKWRNFFEHGNEPSDSIKTELLDEVTINLSRKTSIMELEVEFSLI